jgi:hypothetical protein
MSHDREWLSLAEAGRRLITSGNTVRRLAERRLISRRQIPGMHPRVSATEVAELAAAHTSPAADLTSDGL